MRAPSKKIRVLIVDASAMMRSLLSRLFAQDPELEVVGTAPDAYVAREKLIALRPDVMVLDPDMPKMDGLTFLRKVMGHFPTRTLVVSGLPGQDSGAAQRALEAGAVDVVPKPRLETRDGLERVGRELCARVKAAARGRLGPMAALRPKERPVPRPGKAGTAVVGALPPLSQKIIAIASSTGGTEALKKILPLLPPNLPGTVIVQHMPPIFTKTYAAQLNALCPFEVKEAEEGDKVQSGRVLIAPGNFHMEIVRGGGAYRIKLHQAEILFGVRPAADYLLKSVARYAGRNATGLILTGMGRDGAEGLLAMKEAGASTFAQDEASSVVFGMPKAAIELGAVDHVLPLQRIAEGLMKHFGKKSAA